MSRTDRRARGRAVLVLALVAAGCSVQDRGINTTNVLELDADGFAGAGGAGVGSDGAAGKDGPALRGDGPLTAPPDGQLAGDASASPDAPALGLGATCTTDSACASGFCADGVCCNQRCGEPCHSCGGGNGVTAGTCGNEAANTVCGLAACMGSTLTPAPRCDGNGACTPRMAAACAGSLTCASATACKAKCAADADCAAGLVCDVASGACRPPGKPNGQACAAGTDCASGNCADKVCCDFACTGTCRACVMAQTGKPDGTCANVMAGVKDTRCERQDPSTCGRDGTCNGSGGCHVYPNGTRCATACCRDESGPGNGVHVCGYQCNNGTCDKVHPTILDRCGAATCCCPTGGPGGTPACTGALSCPLGTCL